MVIMGEGRRDESVDDDGGGCLDLGIECYVPSCHGGLLHFSLFWEMESCTLYV